MPSSLAVTTVSPSGLNAAVFAFGLVADELSLELAVGRPDARHAVLAGGDDEAAVGADLGIVDQRVAVRQDVGPKLRERSQRRLRRDRL